MGQKINGKLSKNAAIVYEHNGFAVHYFDRALVDDLADGWELHDIHPFEEGELPRRLWRITQTTPR